MKAVLVVLGVVSFMSVVAWVLGIVGLEYPVVVENQPLLHPVKVVSVEGSRLSLANGQVIAIDGSDAVTLNKQLSQSGYEVDVEGGGEDPVRVWARQDGWICGTRWSKLIKIRLIPVTVYVNKRQIIALGEIVPAGK